MRGRLLFLLVPFLVHAAESPLARVAEEAEVFLQNIPNTLSQETLEQRTMVAPPRFMPRVGAAATEPVGLRLQVRQVISEYAVGPLRGAAIPTLVELRQLVSVDGHPVQSAEQARHALSLGVQSADDRLRKRILEDFAHHGLVDIATEYALILLAFTNRGLAHMTVTPVGEAMLGADRCLLFAWRQNSPDSGELEFRGKHVTRRPLQGILWLRQPDSLPLRVQAWAEYTDPKGLVRDDATVEYTMSSHGFLVPASVLHRHIMRDRLVTENLYRYEPFRKFSADAEIKFTELPPK